MRSKSKSLMADIERFVNDYRNDQRRYLYRVCSLLRQGGIRDKHKLLRRTVQLCTGGSRLLRVRRNSHVHETRNARGTV